MKTYLIIFFDKNPEVLTKKIYYGHIDHLTKLDDMGVLQLAGPLVEQGEVIQIVKAEDKAEAMRLVEADPYISSHYYQKYECYEWIESKKSNNWLMDTPRIRAMLNNLP